MRELPEIAEVRAAWANQPEESPVEIERIKGRRMGELFAITRSEIAGSIGAALFFGGMMAWRFAREGERLVQVGFGVVMVWAVVTLFRFRHSIRRPAMQPDALARTGLEHYRAELVQRRNHLRSSWVWHGPLLLACLLSVAMLGRRIVPGRLWDAAPVVVVLAGWAVIGIRLRWRQAAEIQREIDEISGKETIR